MGVMLRGIAVVAVLVLSGCTSSVGGTPLAGTTSPAELTAEAVFGDLRTVDPCSLTSPDVFDAFGTVAYNTPESLEFCAILVVTADGSEVRIHVGAFADPTMPPYPRGKRTKDVERGLWVAQVGNSPSSCGRALMFPDGVLMQVLGETSNGDADTCSMVEAGMDHAIEVILADGVGHRSPERDSLMLIDPCSLVGDAEIGGIAGLAGAHQRYDYPAKHDCYWEVSSEVSVLVRFGAGPKPAASSAGANEDPVAGRPTAMTPYPEWGTGSFCAVQTAHLPVTSGIFEVAGVYVHMPKGQVNAGCVAARAVAELVWPELPTP